MIILLCILGKTIPVYKDGDESEPCDHQPISLLPQFYIEYLKRSCTNGLSNFLNNRICSMPETVWPSGSTFNRTRHFRYCK